MANEATNSSGYNGLMIQANPTEVQNPENFTCIGFDIDPDKIAREKPNDSKNPSILLYSSPTIPNSPPNTIMTKMASNPCDTDSLKSNNLSDTRHIHLSPSPLHFRRPSFPLYYPSQHYSCKKSPYKRPRSSPLYLPTDKDYYPSIAQSYRRRRSTTPPFKDYKHCPSKQFHLQPANSISEIWSIPREVCRILRYCEIYIFCLYKYLLILITYNLIWYD